MRTPVLETITRCRKLGGDEPLLCRGSSNHFLKLVLNVAWGMGPLSSSIRKSSSCDHICWVSSGCHGVRARPLLCQEQAKGGAAEGREGVDGWGVAGGVAEEEEEEKEERKSEGGGWVGTVSGRRGS